MCLISLMMAKLVGKNILISSAFTASPTTASTAAAAPATASAAASTAASTAASFLPFAAESVYDTDAVFCIVAMPLFPFLTRFFSFFQILKNKWIQYTWIL